MTRTSRTSRCRVTSCLQPLVGHGYCERHLVMFVPRREDQRIAAELQRLRSERNLIQRQTEIAAIELETVKLTLTEFVDEPYRRTAATDRCEHLGMRLRHADRIVAEVESAFLARYDYLPEPPSMLPRRRDPDWRKAYLARDYARHREERKEASVRYHAANVLEVNAKNRARYHQRKRAGFHSTEYNEQRT